MRADLYPLQMPAQEEPHAFRARFEASKRSLMRSLPVPSGDHYPSANDVVRGITRKLAKKFPYRGDIAPG